MEGDLLMKKKVPTEKEIAKKHGVSVETIIKQAEVGSTVEREHVTTHEEAYGIALQHLDEFPDYYTHLLKMEKELKAQHKKKRTVKEMREICENHIAVAMGKEIDDEGGMIMSQLDTIEDAVNRLRLIVQDPKMQLPGWVQSKVTLAADYIDTAADYMSSKNEEYVAEGAAWTKKSGKNSEGGLNEKGRKSYERENPGSDLKAPSKKVGNPRRASFCARMKGMKKKLTSKKTARDPDSRINKSLRAWNC
jgi:DNA-binding transcriptional regulator YhcF (GntR family)